MIFIVFETNIQVYQKFKNSDFFVFIYMCEIFIIFANFKSLLLDL